MTDIVKEPVDYNQYLDEQALTTVEALIDTIKQIPHLDKDIYDISDDPDDEKLWALSTVINDISALVISYIGRNLGYQEYSEVKNNAPTTELNLNNFPVKEIGSISVFNGNSFTEISKESISLLTDLSDMRRGALYMAHIFPSRNSRKGLTRITQNYLKSIKVVYKAGYVLPKDETPDNPSDLPRDLEGVVLKTCQSVFSQGADTQRTDGLTVLQEGNVKREWASNITAISAQFGDISLANQAVLRKYKVTTSVFTV